MSQQLLAPQWGKQLLMPQELSADREFQIWMDDITECVNGFTGGVGGSITINGVLISDLTLEGRSTEFTRVRVG